MSKNKLVIIGLLLTLSLSSCGIFGKSCHCPKFGVNRHTDKNLDVSKIS